jgi:hypothetical protein
MAQATRQACADCGTTRREVQWSKLAQRHTCLSCYLAYAPKGPRRTPYRRPQPPPPTARARAERKLMAAMEKVAPTGYIKGGLASTCPLCRMTLWAYIGDEQTELECWSGCNEALIRRELRL